MLNLSIDRDKSGSLDFVESKRGYLYSGSSKSIVTFKLTPKHEGTYYFKPVLKTNLFGRYIYTDSWAWTKGFCVKNYKHDLHIKVKGIEGEAKVVLYDSDYKFLESKFTSNKKVTFEDLEEGDYYYEVYYKGMYFGNKKVSLKSDVYDDFIRNTPMIDWVKIYNADNGQRLDSASCISPGTTVKIVVNVCRKQGNKVTLNVKVDKEKKDNADFPFTRKETLIKDENPLVFYFTPKEEGTYYCKAELLDFNGEVKFDEKEWQKLLCVRKPKSSLEVYVRNFEGLNYSIGNNGLVILYDSNWKEIDSTYTVNGKANFSGLKPGKYYIEVYNLSNNGNKEFWGSEEVNLDGQSKSVVFTRNMPFVKNVEFIGNDEENSKKCFKKGETIKGKITLYNPSSKLYWVKLSLSAEDGSFGEYSQVEVGPNSEETIFFDIPVFRIGKFYYDYTLESKASLGDKAILTDSRSSVYAFCSEEAQETAKLSFNKGWNLKALPFDNKESVSKFDVDSVATVWVWRNNGWKVWTPNPDFMKVLKKYKFSTFDFINPGEGFWVKAYNDFSVHFEGIPYGIEKFHLREGWNLLGIGKNIKPEDLKSLANNKTLVIWKWNGNDWLVWSSDSNLNSLIKALGFKFVNQIDKGEGFWVFVK